MVQICHCELQLEALYQGVHQESLEGPTLQGHILMTKFWAWSPEKRKKDLSLENNKNQYWSYIMSYFAPLEVGLSS